MFSLILFFLINTQIITNIEAETKFTDSNLIIKTSGIKVGEQYSKYQIALAIQRLYQLKLFETIEVDTIHIADGVQVKFIVKEFPILQDVKFFGNRKIKTKDLIEKTKIKIGEVVTNQKIFDWKLAIQDLYKQKGYILIKVNVQKSEPDSTNRVSIIFQIDEGEKVRIKKIEIIGNSALSDKKIKKRMANKEKVWYRKGLFSEDKFKQDLDNIIELYKEHGFLDAQIVNYDIKFDEQDNNQWLDLTINIDEGRQYYVGDISFVGDSVIKSEQLKSALRIKPNQVYNIKKINQTLVELYSIYSEQGFIYAQITPNEDIINNTINIKYSIVENQPAKIRLVIIEGNERTHDKVIRRQISSLPGSIFKRSDVIRSQRDIFNLGFFEDVKLDYNRVNEQGDIDLIYQVKEKSSFGTIGAGISYSAQDKLTGYMELTQPNLFGKGQQLSIKAEKGGAKTNLQLGFVEPYLFDKPITGGINVSYLTRQYDYYEKKENAISLSFSRPLLLDYSRIHLGINISDVVVPRKSISANYKPTGIYSVYRDTTHRITLMPSISFNRDSRDYIYNPLSGSLISYGLDFSTIDIFFHRHIIDASVYFPMFKKFCLMFRTRMGVIEGFRNKDTVPIYERFYAGGTGVDGIRGYGDRSIGVNEGGYNIGGKAEAIYSSEFKFRPSHQLAFLVFVDAGNTWNSFREFNISNLKRGAGVGVRLEIPMLGLIGFDFGYGFDRDGKGRWEPHFQFGRTF